MEIDYLKISLEIEIMKAIERMKEKHEFQGVLYFLENAPSIIEEISIRHKENAILAAKHQFHVGRT